MEGFQHTLNKWAFTMSQGLNLTVDKVMEMPYVEFLEMCAIEKELRSGND